MFTANKKKARSIDPEEAIKIEQTLQSMAADDTYNTTPTYSANTELYPDHLIPFVDRHMKYLGSHPGIDPWHYISNLRLMTRIK